jgi:hypothetical protein
MQRKQFLICFLLGYLVLLWNFGPSFHRADFFGFNLCAASAASHNSFAFDLAEYSGCCCHGSCHTSPDGPEQSLNLIADHDCAFCDFFDQFNLTVGDCDQPATPAFATFLGNCEMQSIDKDFFTATARGPPVLS